MFADELLAFLSSVQKYCTVPPCLLRIVDITQLRIYKTKDYLSYFLTTCALGIDNIFNFVGNTVWEEDDPVDALTRKQQISSMGAALHLLVLMICHVGAQKFVDDIDLLARDFVQNVVLYFGREYASYNWHILLHIARDIRNHGPLMQSSAFVHELLQGGMRDTTLSHYAQAKVLNDRAGHLINLNPVNGQIVKGIHNKGKHHSLFSSIFTTFTHTSFFPPISN